jgi:hypothetical protein
VLFSDLFNSIPCIASNGKTIMNYGLDRMWKEVVVTQPCLEGLRESLKNLNHGSLKCTTFVTCCEMYVL